MIGLWRKLWIDWIDTDILSAYVFVPGLADSRCTKSIGIKFQGHRTISLETNVVGRVVPRPDDLLGPNCLQVWACFSGHNQRNGVAGGQYRSVSACVSGVKAGLGRCCTIIME